MGFKGVYISRTCFPDDTQKPMILTLCLQELQNRLDEISKSEEKLTELNRELSKQISNMVKEYDQDKREALER